MRRSRPLSVLLVLIGSSLGVFAETRRAQQLSARSHQSSVGHGRQLQQEGDSLTSTFSTVQTKSLVRGGAASSKKAPITQSTLIAIGCLLAANSGFLNGLALSGALVGKNQAVAAVTGAWTTSALGVAQENFAAASTQFKVIASYFGGSCINGLLNPNGVCLSSAPPTALLVAAALVLTAYYSTVQQESLSVELFWCLLTLANGLQNSFTSMLIQGNILRTGHFSGITSDMGTFVGQILQGNTQNGWKLNIFAALAASFWTGSFLSVEASKRWDAKSLLLSVAVYVGLWSYSLLACQNSSKSASKK